MRRLLETQGPVRPPEARNIPLLAIPRSKIEEDPATYQYRIYTNESGLSKDHEIHAKHWDSIVHGDPLIVHERLDSRRFVVDGHHRLSFAKRVGEAGGAPSEMMAYVLKESDGYTAEDAKIIAAFKNISHGNGSIVEAALVLKEARDKAIRPAILPQIDKSKGNLPQAESLSHLSSASIGLVAKGEVPVEMAVDAAKTEDADAVMQHIATEMKKTFAARLLEGRKAANTETNLAM